MNAEDKSPPLPRLIKRPDLWPDELPEHITPDDLDDWKYWLGGLDIVNDVSGRGFGLVEASIASQLPNYPDEHGIPDPEKIISYFCDCHEWGVYPPKWIMNELYQRFGSYLEDNMSGKSLRRLGEYFGESSLGKRSAYFRQKAVQPVMESLCIIVDRFRHGFRLGVDASIGIAVTRFAESGPDVSESSLYGYYINTWGSGRTRDVWEVLDAHPPTVEQNMEFLSQFDEDILTAYPVLRAYLQY